MNEEFVKHARSYGNAGKLWLSQIPGLLSKYKKLWSLQIGKPYRLSYNYVVPVICNGNIRAVLKIGFPRDAEFRSEIDSLKEFNGNGMVQILKSDREHAVMLLERADPGTPLSQLSDDDKATKILADLIRKIRKLPPFRHHFITIREWTSALDEYPVKFAGAHHAPIPLSLVKKAQILFEKLISSSSAQTLTHADLHHDNILSSDNNRWIAIDPKGIIAEPEYETAAMIRNPYKLLSGMDKPESLLRRRIVLLSEILHFDPERIRLWSLAQTILSGVWCADNPNGSAFAVKIARSLERIGF